MCGLNFAHECNKMRTYPQLSRAQFVTERKTFVSLFQRVSAEREVARNFGYSRCPPVISAECQPKYIPTRSEAHVNGLFRGDAHVASSPLTCNLIPTPPLLQNRAVIRSTLRDTRLRSRNVAATRESGNVCSPAADTRQLSLSVYLRARVRSAAVR